MTRATKDTPGWIYGEPPQPKWSVSWLTDDGVVNLGIAVEFDCSDKAQAELIRKAVVALMEFIYEPDEFNRGDLFIKSGEAHNAIGSQDETR